MEAKESGTEEVERKVLKRYQDLQPYHKDAESAAQLIFDTINTANKNDGVLLLLDIESAFLRGTVNNLIFCPDSYCYMLSDEIKKYCDKKNLKFDTSFCSTAMLRPTEHKTLLSAALELNDNKPICREYIKREEGLLLDTISITDNKIGIVDQKEEKIDRAFLENLLKSIEDSQELEQSAEQLISDYFTIFNEHGWLGGQGGSLNKACAILSRVLHQTFILKQPVRKVIFIDNDQSYAKALDANTKVIKLLNALNCEVTSIIIDATVPNVSTKFLDSMGISGSCAPYQATAIEIPAKEILIELQKLCGNLKSCEENESKAKTLEINWLSNEKSRIETSTEIMNYYSKEMITEVTTNIDSRIDALNKNLNALMQKSNQATNTAINTAIDDAQLAKNTQNRSNRSVG